MSTSDTKHSRRVIEALKAFIKQREYDAVDKGENLPPEERYGVGWLGACDTIYEELERLDTDKYPSEDVYVGKPSLSAVVIGTQLLSWTIDDIEERPEHYKPVGEKKEIIKHANDARHLLRRIEEEWAGDCQVVVRRKKRN